MPAGEQREREEQAAADRQPKKKDIRREVTYDVFAHEIWPKITKKTQVPQLPFGVCFFFLLFFFFPVPVFVGFSFMGILKCRHSRTDRHVHTCTHRFTIPFGIVVKVWNCVCQNAVGSDPMSCNIF